MKQLKDYSEDIYKCTKCGLCQSVCPVFDATGLETSVPRGKFTLLNGVLTGKMKFNKKMSSYFDLCLGCGACYEFCPSAIHAEDIVVLARQHSCNVNGISFLKRLIIMNLDSKLSLALLKVVLSLYREMGLYKLAGFLADKISVLRQPVYIFNLQVKENVKYKRLKPVRHPVKQKIVYFPGCINRYVNSSVLNSVRIVLETNGFTVQMPDFKCCGVPARSAGDFATFRKQAEKNLDLIDDDVDVILTDCASCGAVWSHYPDIVSDKYKAKAEKLVSKAVNINKFLAEIDLYIPDKAKIDKTVTYHDPCHLKRFQKVYLEPRDLLKKIPGINFVEMNEADRCCGAAGTFCAVKPAISKAISVNKARNVLETNAEIVSTSCPSCKIGLSQGLTVLEEDIPVYQPVELLAMLYLQD